jgi:signal-transduction protein with cAMP-binding, CBS, and nucleotidyltransferase domain
VGSILVPAVVAINGAKATLVAIGALLAVVALAPLGRLRALERVTQAPSAEVALLRRSPLFESLGAPELEALAGALVRLPLAAGMAAVREGDLGNRFYLIERGALDVSIGGVQVAALGPGDGFGEIALLRDLPRTATVTARTDATVHALERGPFLEAVTGSHRVHEAAERVVAERLARGSAATSPGRR